MFIQALIGTQLPSDPKLVMAQWLAYLAKEDGFAVRLNAEDDVVTITLV